MRDWFLYVEPLRNWTCSPDVVEVWESCGSFAAWTEIKETAGQGHLSTCLLRQLSFIIICLSLLGSCYCSAFDLVHMVVILNT